MAAAADPAPVPLTERASSDPQAKALAADRFQLLQRTFPQLASGATDLSATADAAAGTRVRAYGADNVARIAGPEGKRVVVATHPLRVVDASGRSLPVDLTLQLRDGILQPRTAPFSLQIASDPSRGFSLGPDAAHAVHVTPLSSAPGPAVSLVTNEVFASATHVDGDTVLQPTATGVESYEQLRGPDAPEVFAWRLDLAENQRAKLRDGELLVTQAGRAIVHVPPPVAFDADRTLLSTEVELVGDVLTVAVEHRDRDVRYPVMVDPDWETFYDWSGQPGQIGTAGWDHGPDLSPHYEQFILSATESGIRPGITIQPLKGTPFIFQSPVGSEVSWLAPGSTRITEAHFLGVHRVNESARQTSRVGLFEGTNGGFEVTDDWFDTDRVNDVADLQLDGSGIARFAVVSMFTPPCTIGGVPPNDCRSIPDPTNRTILHVAAANFTLTDDDLPRAVGSGPLRDLADRWTPGTGTQTVAGDFADDGSGVADVTFEVTGPVGAILPQSAVDACDPTHRRLELAGQICPQSLRQTFDVPLGSLPEGKSHFQLGATDFAGNTATGDGWDTYIDRGAPALSVSGPLLDQADTWVDPADVAGGTRLQANDARSGVATMRLTATDETGARVIDDTTDACTPQRPISAPCPTQSAVNVPLDPDTLPEGRLVLSAVATDFAGNVTERRWQLQLDRTRPAARAEGDLLTLQDQWTNRSTPIDVTVTGRDAGAGVRTLRLVAVNADGRTVLGQVDTCDAAATQDNPGASCPERVTRALTIDPDDLPDGKSTFEVEAVDLAGHVSRPDQDWDTYVDHTLPPSPTGLVVSAKTSDTAAIRWERVTDSPEGSPAVSYQYLIRAGDQTVVNWTNTPSPNAVIPGLPPGVDIEATIRSLDAAGNLSRPRRATGRLPLPSFGGDGPQAHAAGFEDFVRGYAPFLLEDPADGFFPISFYWIPRIRTLVDGEPVCIHDGEKCVRSPLTLPLPARRGAGQNLEYPVKNVPQKQQFMIDYTLRFNGGLMKEPPQRQAAMGYYFVSNYARDGTFVIQYWYFWSFNYYDAGLVGKAKYWDEHEGDLEHLDIKFTHTGRPISVTMSRHDPHHYKTFAWRDARLTYTGDHLDVFVAYGDHALYERCSSGLGFQLYQGDGPILAWDRTCGSGPTLGAEPSDIRAQFDSSAARNWACWQGRLGDGPKAPYAPLRQSTVLGAASACGLAEAAAAPSPPAADPTLQCATYEQPPETNSSLIAIACDQQELSKVPTSSVESSGLLWGLRSGAPLRHSDGTPAIAVSDDPRLADQLQLVVQRASRPQIYVATVKDDVETQVRFPATELAAGDVVKVERSGRDWVLRDARGAVLATAEPRVVKRPRQPAPTGPRPPAPIQLRLHRGAHASTLTWRSTAPAGPQVRFVVLARRMRGSRHTELVASVQGNGGRRFSARIANRQLIGRSLRIVASRGAQSRQSRPIRGLRRR